MTSAELALVRKRCFRLSTGSKQWDGILNDGFQSGSINEVYGEFSVYSRLHRLFCSVADTTQDAARLNCHIQWLSSLSFQRARAAEKVGLLS